MEMQLMMADRFIHTCDQRVWITQVSSGTTCRVVLLYQTTRYTTVSSTKQTLKQHLIMNKTNNEEKEAKKNINTQINKYNHKKQNNELCVRCDQGVSCFFSSPQALNFRGRLKLVHGQHRVSEDGTLVPPQLAFFCVASPMQPPAILEIRTKTLIFQTKHRLDFSPMGIDSRYVPPPARISAPSSQLPALNSQLLDLASHDSACFLPLASEGSWSWASPSWSCAWRAPATTSSTPQTWCTAPTRTFGVSLTPSLCVEMLRHFFKIERCLFVTRYVTWQ